MYSLIRSKASLLSIFLAIMSASVSVAEAGVEEASSAYRKQDYAKAALLWQQEADSAASLDSHVIALNNLALTYLKLNRVDEASDASSKSLKLVDAKDKVEASIYAQTLMVAGNVNEATGNRTSAIALWQDAKELYKNKNLAAGRVKASLNLLKAYAGEGFYNRMREELVELETVSQKIEGELLTQTLLAMGNSYQLIGDDATGLAKIEQAAKMDNSSQTNLAMARFYKYKGDYDKANAYLDSLVVQRRGVGGEELSYQIGLEKQQLALQQQNYAEVVAIGEQLLAKDLPVGNSTINWQLNNIDNLVTSIPQGQRLGGLSDEVLKLEQQGQRLNNTQAQSMALYQLARIYQLQNKQDEAIVAATKSLAADSLKENYQAYWLLTRSYQSMGDYNKAIAFNQKAIETIDRIKGDLVTNPEFQLRFNAETRPIYDNLVALAVDRPGGASQEDLKLARNAIESLQIVELENYFRLACLESESKQLDEIDPLASAIYPIFLEDRVVTIAAIGGKLAYHQQDLSRESAKSTVAELRASLNPAIPKLKRQKLSQQVYSWLVKPFEAQLKTGGIETLAFVVNGELRNLPLGAVENEAGEFLIEQFNVAVAPGLSLLDNSPEKTKLDSMVLGGMSDPRQGFTPLPGVEREVAQIAELDYKDDILFNEDFTDQKLYTDLKRSKAPIVHVATHGQFSSDNEDTFILSWNEKISVNQLRNLLRSRSEIGNNAGIELLVLSACETAVGDERAALGLAGIAVRSGAKSTVASLWQVNDDSTATLMSNFYRQLQTNTDGNKAKALREAQLELIKDGKHSHPYYWAPFIMVGNWI